MIVKVQVPININEETLLALVHNKNKSFLTQVLITSDILNFMCGEYKLFFYAKTIKETDGRETLILECEAPWQDW